ncbi:ATP-grasp domain-containing protein [Clostridium sporogenes]|uniref:ATP-grasp domain-containing protein n=1 Tax=Clostridium TaxID=1485 RepID=UPI0013D79B3C|nr:ATP-grasp domain-containing protein [Clostridium sporogenes]EJP6470958.1 ATP-grasp domain-containing protein [Clostridium botulinum]NFV12941.1 ATP-grasp domain-containing protein [Clostridium sporogenes]
MSNILILDIGARNKLVRYFKKELLGRGNVVVADCSRLAPALYDADKYYIVPRCMEKNYVDEIKKICIEEKISLIIPLLEDDLLVISKNKNEFEKLGIKCLISDYDIIEKCFDKYIMFEYFQNNGFKTQLTYKDIKNFMKDNKNKKIQFPVFIKPNKGCGSNSTDVVENLEMLEVIFKRNDDFLIQELMSGREIGVDVYVDIISKEVVAIFAKEKIRMLGGETDKSLSFKDEKLFTIIKQFVEKMNLIGVIDIDVFEVDDEYYISEVNPRFGGGYLHAYACGVNFPKYIIENMMNKINNPCVGKYEDDICMMKYKDVKIIDLKER